MRVDFYQLSSDPVAVAVASLAKKVRQTGERVLVVSAEPEQRSAISKALWEAAPEAFLANGMAGGPHDDRQPILLADQISNANSASFLMLADGTWRDPGTEFARAMLFFDTSTIEGARGAWRKLVQAGGAQLHYWEQVDGRWVERG